VFPLLGSINIRFSSYPLKAKYMELMDKDKDTTQVMHIAKLKDGPKRAMKLSQIILERVLKMVWWRGRKWTHVKRF
jgi:hypothetical protein